jgi:hypothetical protein
MNLDQHTTPLTVQMIYDHYKKQREGKTHRPHLGGSQIGHECSRALWYQFRWAWSPKFEGRMLRLFETGDREEERIVRNLRDIGVTVWERDPETGKQIRAESCGGHFALSLDGVAEGLPESKKPHTLEFKTMNDKSFKSTKSMGVQKSKPVYWAQCQIGMHLIGIDRCLFIAVNKNTDEIYAERIKLDVAEALKLNAKAESIVFADTPPEKMSQDPSDWRCKFCPYWAVCHGCKIPEVSCRTCANVTPERDGTWSCAKGRSTEEPCVEHLFIPKIMPSGWEVMDASPEWVEYHDEDGEIVRNQNNSADLFNGRMKGAADVGE